jgi:hypothetical protein
MFVLVGHSYGGMIVTGVATLAWCPDQGARLPRCLPAAGWPVAVGSDRRLRAQSLYQQPEVHACRTLRPLPGLESPVLSPHPLSTCSRRSGSTGEEAKVGRRIYVFANAWEPTPFRVRRARDDREGLEITRPRSSHNVMAISPNRPCRSARLRLTLRPAWPGNDREFI